MSFYIGQKIQCINDDWGFCHIPNLPKRGKVYTMRGVSEQGLKILGLEYIWLFEITNPKESWRSVGFSGEEETAFNAKYFVPVEERKTDISIFTEILNSTKVPTPEHVS